MYHHNFKYQKNDIPYLRKEEMDKLAEIYLSDFQAATLITPTEIDIDSMAEFYLRCSIRFEFLSHGQLYLGLCAFHDCTIQIFNPEANCAEDLQIKGRTLVIDTSLDNIYQEHRYRFTLAHEIAHFCLHRRYYSQDANQISFFDEGNESGFTICKSDIEQPLRLPSSQWTERDTLEWQANCLGAAILMPKSMVYELIKQFKLSEYVYAVSNTFNVSEEAAYYRLKGLGCFEDNSVQQEMR